MFARPEIYSSKMIVLYCYGKSGVIGVVRFFMSAKVAGEDSAIAVMHAVMLQSANPTKRPRKDIARQKRVRKLIVRPKIAAG